MGPHIFSQSARSLSVASRLQPCFCSLVKSMPGFIFSPTISFTAGSTPSAVASETELLSISITTLYVCVVIVNCARCSVVSLLSLPDDLLSSLLSSLPLISLTGLKNHLLKGKADSLFFTKAITPTVVIMN